MAGNSFGTLFRITTFGESHGRGIGVVIDGCPPGITIDPEAMAFDLSRRRPGQSELVSDRMETDNPEILSGIMENTTTGAPIALWISNKDAKPADYDALEHVYRPSHADYTYQQKYGIRDHRGAGRASARETAARVAAGAVAKALLGGHNISIQAFVEQIGGIRMRDPQVIPDNDAVEANLVRCPDPEAAAKMERLVSELKQEGDSTGGVIRCSISNCPVGLGEPVFDRLEADLAKAMLSINASKGFSIGSGYQGASMRGSEHNDAFYTEKGTVKTRTNFSGGVQGGISNGMEIYFTVAFKPVSTILKPQESINTHGESQIVAPSGRHDPCVVPRAVPIVEAMTALVLADHLLKFLAMKRGEE